MSGYPSRIVRSVLGPTFKDVRPVEHPEREISAESGNLLCNIATAANLIQPRASLVAIWSGSAFAILHQEEAWNVDHAQTHPQLERSSAGVYSYTFASSYKDKDGVDVPTTLVSARVTASDVPLVFSPADAPRGAAFIDPAVPYAVQIRTWSGTTLGDYRFWLEVL